MAPKLMRTLSVVGTAAMFLVGGGILVHGMPMAAEALHYVEELVRGLPAAGNLAAVLAGQLFNGLFGVLAGSLLVGAAVGIKRLLPGR